ncbi:DEAD/DEAH box helicase [Xanthomonas campestris]|uniref:DNA2/NAM7 helicase-like C-terminal domain-containing protein n=1 Tax=Xanthomonas campestris pv. campestris (strain 8004) TaxID=314565 RepID=A0A0H2X9Z0_XANC8|nr:DEAD/DEAH box helicase [Xanthomonas campestris]AAY49474.1 conserved hypothetical protein [Xanthomonas campestris pv. campestris str. 8004]MBD8246548.1 hypothetical protein [Xanthomonas campestris]QCX68029.1 hypothetical protein DFG55_17865 [Xanthomonas campestris pv. campestris]QCX71474.1 hypothetical protein DFG54_12560 [Xanthomonas campestris pv. campestris]
MSRPHLSKSIDQLEELYAASLSDEATLAELAEELGFRRTPRAKELATEVVNALNRYRAQDRADSAHNQAPPAPRHAPNKSMRSRPEPGDTAEHPAGPTISPPDLEPVNYTNRAPDILDAWSALEVLSPTTFKRRAELASNIAQNIVSIGPGLPWDSGSARSKPNFKVYFHIILGTLAAEPAFSKLLTRFQDARPNPPNIKGEVVLASILVDKDGLLAGEMPVSLSAFGWGLPVALGGSLQSLAAWTQEEGRLIEGLTKQLRPDPSGTDTPITYATIQKAFSWLVQTLGLPAELVQGPQFAVAAYIGFRSSLVPDPLLLNSFFLRDLARAKDRAMRQALPPALARFLGQTKPSERHDLLHDPQALDQALSPATTPLGRWITPANQRPALLQQAAVNLASQLPKTSPLLGVNGPPGTGKSTLLRDVVADQLTRRAEAMCAFNDPNKAFKTAWSKRIRGENQELFALDPSLRGFEMVVASSNNKAVENISEEIPALKSIASGSTLRYFEPLATQLLGKNAWGLSAAVLGNGANRSRFRKAFWTESHLSFKTYLERVSGITPRQEADPEGLADLCQAPANPAEAMARWQQTKQNFQTRSAQVSKRLAELEALRQALSALPSLRQREEHASRQRADAEQSASTTMETWQTAQSISTNARSQLEGSREALSQHERDRPGLFALKRLFGSISVKQWEAAHTPLAREHDQAQVAYRKLKSEEDAALQASEQARKAAHDTAASHVTAKDALDKALARCASIQVGDGACVLDASFHDLEHGAKNLALPWLDRDLQTQRSELFEAAMDVHRAFIDAAALPLLRNLNGLVGSNFKLGADRKQLAADLWASLFLVVPVISTAFASVERMLNQLPDESLGWLLVDEAGQATPQSTVGALLRTKHALIVGDPLQVEPVVPLPPVLTQAVMREFKVDPDRFAAPNASAQTLADDGSLHCARFETTSGSRAVGAPLLVHRRCASPMFDISNRVAYNNLMVQAKVPDASLIRDVLGPSRWIDIRGSGRDKYSPEEGEQVIALLRLLQTASIAPDLYVVTPFVVVQDELRELVRRSGLLTGWVDSPYEWTKERIGTVHTVQGREAQAVIFVLGAPQAAQHGARGWAGSTPNLLNVAVTRAKEAVYVIGNRSLWSGAGHFAMLDQML